VSNVHVKHYVLKFPTQVPHDLSHILHSVDRITFSLLFTLVNET